MSDHGGVEPDTNDARNLTVLAEESGAGRAYAWPVAIRGPSPRQILSGSPSSAHC